MLALLLPLPLATLPLPGLPLLLLPLPLLLTPLLLALLLPSRRLLRVSIDNALAAVAGNLSDSALVAAAGNLSGVSDARRACRNTEDRQVTGIELGN